MFGFGSHPGGRIANFSMAFPSGDDLGVIERATVYIVGGDHWLAGEAGKKVRLSAIIWTFGAGSWPFLHRFSSQLKFGCVWCCSSAGFGCG